MSKEMEKNCTEVEHSTTNPEVKGLSLAAPGENGDEKVVGVALFPGKG